MAQASFAWDERKDRANRKKHGVSFDDARTVFLDDNARLLSDPGHAGEEDRFVLLGMSSRLCTLVVCHCYREQDAVIRIISARKATRRERAQYEGYLQ